MGAQNTIGAGGRYDGLIASLGGPDLPSIGCATGLERVLQVMVAQGLGEKTARTLILYFIPIGEEAREKCLELTTLSRHQGISADIDLSGKKMERGIQNGLRLNARYCVIVGGNELSRGVVQLKELATRQQKEVPVSSLFKEVQ